MLTSVEQILFFLLALFSIGAAYQGFREVWLIINRGQGDLHLTNLVPRAINALQIYLTQSTTLKTRKVTSLFHLGVVWGFTFYFLVNFVDMLIGYIDNFKETLEELGFIYHIYQLMADVLSIAVLVGVSYFIIRRFWLPNKKELQYHGNILLHPKVKEGKINTDSLIVAIFILAHVGSRFLGEAVAINLGEAGEWMPFAAIVSVFFDSFSTNTLELLQHVFWWTALGGILLFLPYFPYTKHFHLVMAPLNFLTTPERTSIGEMEALDLEDEDIEQFGANKLEHLSKTQIFDAFACIMCNRCQDVCPAYTTGKELSPSALEINKRYVIKDQMTALANGQESRASLIGTVISESAVWACTTCAACIDICPVGNAPMMDILNIRRDAAMMESEFPDELQPAFLGMERNGNPWQISESRLAWTEGLDFDVPTFEENPDFEILYWVGCAASYDPRAQQVAQALCKVLHKAGVSFAILGEAETCTGDSARRAGREDLYYEMATTNVETLNEVKPPRIVVTCPHCLHNLGKEYHQFGGNYDVIHHTELIEELIAAGKVPMEAHPNHMPNVTFHDPCYLSRHNNITSAPRVVLDRLNDGPIVEMPRHGKNSFCCGAGGAQFWKEEEAGDHAVNVVRYEEAKATGADVMAVGCPFCMQMFASAQAEVSNGPEIKDIAELIAERLSSN